MMTHVHSAREQFALAAASRRDDLVHREKMARLAVAQQQVQAERELTAKRQEADLRALAEQTLAPPARIAEFQGKLDTYDTKTVEALIENQEAMERVRKQLDDMLGKAHVLPDGRRVFRTTDGKSVFDENGLELDPSLVDPSSIDDQRPTWEMFKAAKDQGVRLQAERDGLLTYQEKLDHARERLGQDDLTGSDLTRLEDDLRATMPETVRAKVDPDRPKADTAPVVSSMPDGMDALMRQTGLGPSLPGLR